MVELSDNSSVLDRFRAIARGDRHSTSVSHNASAPDGVPSPAEPTTGGSYHNRSTATNHTCRDDTSSTLHPPAVSPTSADRHGEAPATIEVNTKENFAIRFYQTAKEILLSSPINILLVFVPVGIAVNFAGISPTIVFALNAIAIIPLAGLLSHATESVAASMGDTIGALMNVTFGNAVELIIFIALVKNEIRIVQASLLGSILANLMLILGMCFLFGGLRFREQIYNSTVTQMSACLLSLSVMSLLLPTAFHASFTDVNLADRAVLQVSRGSSIILLLVYVLYLLFQLKSHAYMYESTPQHVIDEESHPGLLADMLGSSSSSDTSDSFNDTDSEHSSGSNTTAKRIRRALRGRRRRKSSVSSKEAPSMPSAVRTPSVGTFSDATRVTSPIDFAAQNPLGAIASGDEADTDGEHEGRRIKTQVATPPHRHFDTEKSPSGAKPLEQKHKKKGKRKHRKHHNHDEKQVELPEKITQLGTEALVTTPMSQRVSFLEEVQLAPESSLKRPFNLRGLSVRPAIPKMLTTTVFSTTNDSALGTSAPTQAIVPPAPYGLRRASSLPDRLNKAQSAPSTRPQQHPLQANASTLSIRSKDSHVEKKYISRTSAVVLLLVSTALVAVCAEFLVSSINYLVDNTSVSEEFIGLIVLPIVGNAAEHVTAVTVASKNKMDLAIGVAVGSSIQIALFVTPVIVLLGWALAKDMSLYFSLFETVSLFVSAFIVNFLVLDGRSNYLEGALLIAAYTIIAVAAFFYPDSSQQSVIGGSTIGNRMF